MNATGFNHHVWQAELEQMRADEKLYAVNCVGYVNDDNWAQAKAAAEQVRSVQRLIEEHENLYELLRTGRATITRSEP